jgi:hypothetical protein
MSVEAGFPQEILPLLDAKVLPFIASTTCRHFAGGTAMS